MSGRQERGKHWCYQNGSNGPKKSNPCHISRAMNLWDTCCWMGTVSVAGVTTSNAWGFLFFSDSFLLQGKFSLCLLGLTHLSVFAMEFCSLRPFVGLKTRLMSVIEKIIKAWRSSETDIGNGKNHQVGRRKRKDSERSGGRKVHAAFKSRDLGTCSDVGEGELLAWEVVREM